MSRVVLAPEVRTRQESGRLENKSEAIRWLLVDEVRSKLDDDNFDEDRKIDAILDRLAADLGIELTD